MVKLRPKNEFDLCKNKERKGKLRWHTDGLIRPMIVVCIRLTSVSPLRFIFLEIPKTITLTVSQRHWPHSLLEANDNPDKLVLCVNVKKKN